MRYEGVIFDMDGTLIESSIDFQGIRAHLDIPADSGILEAIESLPADQRARAEEYLLSQELASVDAADLIDGAAEAVAAVGRAGLRTALLTRNAPEAMQRVLDRFPELRFDLTWSRAQGPIKPGPEGVRRACDQLGIDPGRTVCVGDFHYDILAANRAGAISVLLARDQRPPFADEADHVIEHLGRLPALLGLDREDTKG